jgi:hypothetical protein
MPADPRDSAASSLFQTLGFIIVRSAISPSAARELYDEVCDLSATPGGGESGCPPFDPRAPSTWPRGRARRVREVSPSCRGPAWGALLSSAPLARALDELLGAGAWELPRNEAREGSPRHWYAPCVAPEGAAPAAAAAAGAAAAAAARCAAPPRACPFAPCGSPGAPAAAWAPVSRRRFLGLGWHIDVGPGVPSSVPRAAGGVDGHRAGAVLLVALSPCPAGGGGTALLPGSHRWVAARLAALGQAPHEELNVWAAAALRRATERERRVLLPSCACGADAGGGGGGCAFACAAAAAAAAAAAEPAEGGGGLTPLDEGSAAPIYAQQFVGEPGDVLIFHPLLLHSGTSNEAAWPRLMLNGMARLKN